MFQVSLTSFGQTLVSELVNIDGIILLYDTVDVATLTSISSYTVQLDEEACGNLKNSVGNVFIRDLSNSQYQAKTILFYKNINNEKKIVAGYSQETPLVQKTSSILSIYLTLDFSVFTHGFLFASIQAGYSTASHNTDGLLHLENPSIDSDDDYAVYSKSQTDDLLQDKQDTLTAGDGIAITSDVVRTTGIPFGICDGTSTNTVFTVTVPGIYKLEDGVCCLVKNGIVTSASGWTLNVNGLGAKPVYSNMAAATRETTIFNVNYTMLFVYDSTRIESGAWVCYRGYFSDANSIAYQIRGNVHTLPTTAKFYRYRLLFTSADGTHFVPSNTSTSTNATALRDVVQTPIDPFGEIVYYSTTAAVEANANPGPTYLWTQYAVTLGYSFNRTGAALALDSFKPLYIKCATQSDGSAIIDSTTPYVQTLPSTADGKIYIFLGITSSTTVVELLNNHPVYYHDGTGIRLWHGKDSYSKSEIDTIVAGYVPTSRKVNNKALTSDITLTLDDVADGTNRVIPTVNDSTITIKKNASDTGDSFTTNAASGKTINLGLSDVATSGSYNDLSNTPTIPTVNNAKLTIKKNTNDTGTEFTANASTDVTCNLNLADVASSGSYNDLSNTPTIPTDTSDLTNGAGFLVTETDPTVPSWAKQSSKPSYTLDEVTDGSTRKLSDYVPTSRKVNNKTLTSDITLTLDDVADGTNRSIPIVNNATLTIQKNGTTVNTFTANASSPVTANITVPTTVAELTDASNYVQNSSLSSLVATAQYNSADKTIEFYNASGTKLSTDIDATAFIKDGMVDDVEITGGNLVISFNTDAGKEDIEIPISDIFDANNYYTKTQVDNLIPTVNNATLTIQKNGTTVNTFTANASSPVTANITVPTTVAELSDSSNYVTTNDLATVATSGDYDDLINKPTIPTVNNATLTIKKTASDTGTTFTANASTDVTCNLDLATVATSGSYNDLSNTPTIPTVNNATLTIQRNGTTVDTFTANASSDVTVDITVPTNTNQLTNGAGFITSSALSTYVEKVDPATENAIVRFRNVKGDLKDSGVLIDDNNNVILPTGRDTANADKNPHIDIGQSWIGNISSRESILYVGTLASNNHTARYAFQQTAFKPMTDDSYSLGFTSFRWKYLYLSNSIKNGSYTYSLPSATGTLALTSDIPTNVSQLTNDSGYLTSYTETDPTVPSWAKEQNKPSYTLDEVSDGTTRKLSDYVPTSRTVNSKALTTDITLTLDDVLDGTNRSIPTDTSDLTNGAGYITGYTETDPTVPAWAKESTKPSYTASEVGALPDSTVIPTATTARGDNNYLYNGQNVDTLIDNVGISSSNNLINTSGVTSYIALRANSNNPFLGLKCGSNLWYAQAASNYFYFGPTSSNALRLDQSGNGVFQTGTCTATGFVYKNGNTTGTSAQFLKADGSIDSNTYLTSASLAGYVPTSRTINSQALTSDITLTLDDISDGTNRVIPTTTSQLTNNSGFITSSDLPTNHVTTDTVQTITALKTFTNGIDLGTYHTSASQTLSTQLTVWDDTTNYQGGIEVTGNFNPATEDEYNLGSSNFPWKNVYANSFIKSGGTSAQFLKADGSVDSNTYLTSSDLPSNHVTTNTTQEITGAKTIAEDKLKIGDTTTNEDIDKFVFKRGQEFIVGTQSSATSLWKGVTSQSAIYEGMCINYLVPVACTSTAITLELTLPDNTTTGAIPIRRNAGNTATNSHIGVGSVVQLTLLFNRTVGSTSYEKVWKMNEWYDSNTNTIGYQIRAYAAVLPASDTSRYYKLFFTSADGTAMVPASVNSSNNVTTARTANQRPIDPFGRIAYTSASTNYTQGTNVAAATLWDQYQFNLSYSFGPLTLTSKQPVYIVCNPQSNGSAIIDQTTPFTQTLPSTADGKIYIFIGIAYYNESSSSMVELMLHKPVYYNDGTGIRLWTGASSRSEVYCTANTEVGYNQILSEDDHREQNPNNTDNNPKYNGSDVSLGVNQYLDLQQNIRISVYVVNTTYVGSIAFLSAPNSQTYAAYPIYFRGHGSAHNATVPGGSVLRLTFRQNAFDVDFYDIADFGVEHEPYVRVGKVPHARQYNSYNGALVGIRKSDGKFDNILNVNASSSIVTETVLDMEPNSPIYVSFMHECFAAHPHVPFGFITNLEYIYEDSEDPTSNNIPFVYVVNGTEVTSAQDIRSHVVTNPKNNQRYFHIDNAPVYLLLSDDYDPLFVSIGGLPTGSTGVLIGYQCIGTENAGLIRLVPCHLPTLQADSARMLINASNAVKLVAEGSSVSARDKIIPNVNSTSSSTGYDLGSTTRYWKNVYANGFVKRNGTSSQFLKADGSVDSNTYLTTDTAQSITGEKTFITEDGGGNGSDIKIAFSNNATNYVTISCSSYSSTYYQTPYIRHHFIYNNGDLSSYIETSANYTYDSLADEYYLENMTTAASEDSVWSLGTSSYKLHSIWAYTFHGYLNGNADSADSASQVKLLGNSTSNLYPLVFAESINSSTATAVNKQLYTDTVNTLYYNPNSNLLGSQKILTSRIDFDNDNTLRLYCTEGADGYEDSLVLSFQPDSEGNTLMISAGDAAGGSVYTYSSWDLGTSSNEWNNVYANFYNGFPIIPRGECSTSTSEQAKTVTLTPAPVSLKTGMVICVQFTNTNSASSPTLNVNSLGAKPLYIKTNTYAGTSPDLSWQSGTTVLLRYNGSQWLILNWNPAPTSTADGTTNIIPSANNTYNLGSSSYKWNYVYSTYTNTQSATNYVGNASYTYLRGVNTNMYGTTKGTIYFFKLTIKNNSSSAVSVPKGVTLTNTTYFGTSKLQITEWDERVDDTGHTSTSTTTAYTGTFYTMMKFTIPASSSGTTVYVPCFRSA